MPEEQADQLRTTMADMGSHEWENDGWCQNGVREYLKCVHCGVGYREDEPEPRRGCWGLASRTDLNPNSGN